MFSKVFHKLVLVIFTLSLFMDTAHAMQSSPSDSDDEQRSPPKLKLEFSDPPQQQGGLMEIVEEDQGGGIGREQVFVMDAEQLLEAEDELPQVIRDPNNLTYKKLNRYIERLKGRKNRPDFLKELNLVPGLIIIANPQDAQRYQGDFDQSIQWDNHRRFVRALDERFYQQPRSKKTYAIMIPLSLLGMMPVGGMGPLVLYLGQNILEFIPVNGDLSIGIISTVMALTAAPLGRQMYERGEIIGNFLFDGNGFSTSKDDKEPHVTKLKTETETRCKNRCCRYIVWNYEVSARVQAVFNALMRALPPSLLFWEAESPFPTYRWVFIVPLTLMHLEKGYSECLESRLNAAYRRLAQQNHMVWEKKQIMLSRLKEMHALLNMRGNDSDLLVDAVYQAVQNNIVKDEGSDQWLSAFSILLLKCMRADTHKNVEEELMGSVKKYSHVRRRKPTREEDLEFEESSPLIQAAEAVKSMKMQNLANLTVDIATLPPKSTARDTLEGLAVYIHGAGTVARYFISQWAIQRILTYWGAPEDRAFYTGLGVATVDIVYRAIGEWSLQEEATLSFRKFANRMTDFWPMRWITTTFSSACSAFFTLPAVAILWRVFDDSPLYIKVLMAVAISPSEFNSFFEFFSNKYSNLISGISTIHIKTIEQKRAWLNLHFPRAKDLIRQLDDSSTDELYYLSQEGI